MIYNKIRRTQLLKTDIDTLWNFMSSPVNLKAITPKYMLFDIISKNNDEKIYPGEQKSGDIFAWPPWRMHGVDRATSHRLIVAGNIMLKTFNDSDII